MCLLHVLLLFQMESWFSYLGKEITEENNVRFELNIVYNIPLALSFNIVLSYKVKFWVPIRIENAAKCNKCTKSSCRIVVLFNLLNC